MVPAPSVRLAQGTQKCPRLQPEQFLEHRSGLRALGDLEVLQSAARSILGEPCGSHDGSGPRLPPSALLRPELPDGYDLDHSRDSSRLRRSALVSWGLRSAQDCSMAILGEPDPSTVPASLGPPSFAKWL